jgi:hypothetical protein
MLALKNSGYNFISSDVAFKKNCGGPTSIEMHSENCSFIKTFPLLENLPLVRSLFVTNL